MCNTYASTKQIRLPTVSEETSPKIQNRGPTKRTYVFQKFLKIERIICKPYEIFFGNFTRNNFLQVMFQTVIVQQPIVRPPNYMWLSCVVFWLCNWLVGGFEFALSCKLVLRVYSHSLGSRHVVCERLCIMQNLWFSTSYWEKNVVKIFNYPIIDTKCLGGRGR